MMDYSIYILPRAQRELKRLRSEIYKRVLNAIHGLAQEPRPPGCRKLKDRDGWRIRIGDYRVVYQIDDQQQIVAVSHVGHRRDVYR